jgi:hypothetical protein
VPAGRKALLLSQALAPRSGRHLGTTATTLNRSCFRSGGAAVARCTGDSGMVALRLAAVACWHSSRIDPARSAGVRARAAANPDRGFSRGRCVGGSGGPRQTARRPQDQSAVIIPSGSARSS